MNKSARPISAEAKHFIGDYG